MTTGGQGRAGSGSPTPSADSPCFSIRLFLHSLSWEQPKNIQKQTRIRIKISRCPEKRKIHPSWQKQYYDLMLPAVGQGAVLDIYRTYPLLCQFTTV